MEVLPYGCVSARIECKTRFHIASHSVVCASVVEERSEVLEKRACELFFFFLPLERSLAK